MMNESSMLPGYQASHYPHGFEFDYQADFTQFLEEARNNAGQGTPNTAYVGADRKELTGDIKNKRSWKKTLFSWLKKDKKKEHTNGIPNPITKASRGLFSGPVQRSERPITRVRSQRAVSGPLTSLCGSRPSSEDYDVPYASLRQLSDPRRLQYGPVYLVT